MNKKFWDLEKKTTSGKSGSRGSGRSGAGTGEGVWIGDRWIWSRSGSGRDLTGVDPELAGVAPAGAAAMARRGGGGCGRRRRRRRGGTAWRRRRRGAEAAVAGAVAAGGGARRRRRREAAGSSGAAARADGPRGPCPGSAGRRVEGGGGRMGRRHVAAAGSSGRVRRRPDVSGGGGSGILGLGTRGIRNLEWGCIYRHGGS